MRVPKRIIDRIPRRLEQELAVCKAGLAPVHQPLFAPLVLAIVKAPSCYVSEAARELGEELGGSIAAREEKLLHFLHGPKFRPAALKEAHRKRLRKELKRSGGVRICADLPGRDEPLTLVVFSNRQGEPVALLTKRLCRNARHALCIIGDYLGRWHGAEDPVRFLKQAFRLEKFLADGMVAIRAWFFLILVAFSLLFTLRRGREILRWILRYAQAFDKEVHFAYYRILRGFRRLERSVQFPLLGSFPPPRPP